MSQRRTLLVLVALLGLAGCIPRHLVVGVKDRDGDGFYGAAWCQPDTIDRYGDEHGYCDDGGDCDDLDQAVHPSADERCGDGVDNDCDGVVDDTGLNAVTFYRDGDGDGAGDPATTVSACVQPQGYVSNADDCDDGDDDVRPGATETCNDRDDDCDDEVDEGAVDAATWYFDGDDDGYGLTAVSTQACDEPANYAALPGDCLDSDNDVNPGADEVCNGIDDDCDSDVDDEDASVDLDTATDWFLDGDGDGYGAGAATNTCGAPSADHVLDGTDCDDASSLTHPGAAELCDGVDNDCDESLADEAGRVAEEYPGGPWVDITLSMPGSGNSYLVDSPRTVWFCDGVYDPEIHVTSAGVALIGRNGRDEAVLSGLGAFTPVWVEVSSGRVDIDGLTVTRGLGTDGGAVHSQAGAVDLHIARVRLADSIGGRGGGLWFGGGTLTLEDTQLQDNVAQTDGGGAYIASLGSQGIVLNSSFQRNQATTGGGGGLVVEQGDIRLETTVFIENTAGGGGGALDLRHNTEADVVVDGCAFQDNQAGTGGAIRGSAAALQVSACGFTGNAATGSGGAIILDVDDGPLTIDQGSTFVNNSASSGGAMRVFRAGLVTVRDAQLTGNQAVSGSGGAVYAEDAQVDFIDCAVHDNTATMLGGALMDAGQVTFSCSGPSGINGVYGNTAAGGGGAVYVADGATLTTLGCNMGGAGGVDDNSPEDVLSGLSGARACYAGVVTFACTDESCTPANSCP